MKHIINILITCCLLFSIGCSDFLEAEDSRYVNENEVGDVLERSPDALILGVYSRMIQYGFYASRHDDFGQKSLDISVDIWAEDIVHYANQQWFSDIYHMEERVANDRRPNRQWQYCYANIRDLNTILTALPENEADFSEDQSRLKGESLALRAYNYFLLVNLYQTGGEWDHIKDLPGVPVYLEPTLEGGPRGKVSDVYERILADYEEAIPLLAGFKTELPTRVTQIVAKALAARAYLYAGQYPRALELASDVVAESTLMSPNDYLSGFASINNVEWIWGVSVNAENTTSYASFFSIMDGETPGYAGSLGQYKCIDRRLYDNIHEDDIRKQCFKDAEYDVPYMQYKFVDLSGRYLGDLVYLRIAEAYYIKAESEARTGNIAGAHATMDEITNARTLSGTHSYIWSSNLTELIDQIFIQKRIELWGEGLGIFEFNRLEKTIDRTYAGTNHPVGNIVRDGDQPIKWKDALRTLQVPNKEFEGNPNLTEADQNPL